MIRGPDGPRQLREHERRNSRPSFIPSAGPKIDVQCTLPGRGRRNGLRAGSRASGGHAGRAKGGWRCARACPARILRRDSDARSRVASAAIEPRRRKGAASTTGLVKDHAQRFLVRINDVVDEPLARGRMDHQEYHRPLRPIMQHHFRPDPVRRLHRRGD
jgi:hypothetical protein